MRRRRTEKLGRFNSEKKKGPPKPPFVSQRRQLRRYHRGHDADPTRGTPDIACFGN
jgi:hypothetical protein